MRSGEALSAASDVNEVVHDQSVLASEAEGANPSLSTTLPTTTAVDEGSVAALVDDAGAPNWVFVAYIEQLIESAASEPKYETNPLSDPAFVEGLRKVIAEPEPESRQHLDAARELMLKSKGYGDRPGRRPSTNRLLMKNFGQRPPIDNTEEFRANHERIFGTERPALNPGQREGYVVRAYKPKVLPEIINNDPHGYDRLDEQKESDE